MMYGLASKSVSQAGFNIELERKDIEALNQAAKSGKLDCTATSVHAYSYISENYKLLTTAASFAGKDYGPRLLSKGKLDLADKRKLKIAVPGELTSASLALKIFMAENRLDHDLINMEFGEISSAVASGNVDGGVVIHEGQLTHDQFELEVALDLGKWWWKEKNLPLPLGIMVVNNSFSEFEQNQIRKMIQESILYSQNHREEALKYAQQFRRGLSIETLDKYVDMYVNELTFDMGATGKKSIELFLNEGRRFKLIKENFLVSYI
jgi:1,4-dihydroxy-6-naphthoate synthase